jgi:hypothetical protein
LGYKNKKGILKGFIRFDLGWLRLTTNATQTGGFFSWQENKRIYNSIKK